MPSLNLNSNYNIKNIGYVVSQVISKVEDSICISFTTQGQKSVKGVLFVGTEGKGLKSIFLPLFSLPLSLFPSLPLLSFSLRILVYIPFKI